MKTKILFIKCTNWILAGLIGLLGFAGSLIFGCVEYGSPSADYTVKGAVVNNATGKPIKGIRVGYFPEVWDEDIYGPYPENYRGRESNAYVITNTKGGFKLTANRFPLGSNNKILPVYVEDIDEEENGLFQSKMVEADFEKSVHSGKPGTWYEGEYTVTKTIKLTEIENE